MVPSDRGRDDHDRHDGRCQSADTQRSARATTLRAAARRGRLGTDPPVRAGSAKRAKRYRVAQLREQAECDVRRRCRDSPLIRYADRPPNTICGWVRRLLNEASLYLGWNGVGRPRQPAWLELQRRQCQPHRGETVQQLRRSSTKAQNPGPGAAVVAASAASVAGVRISHPYG